MNSIINLSTYGLLIIEIMLLGSTDRKIFGTWITPFNLLSVPFLSILTLILIFGSVAGLYPFHYASLWVWIVGLAVFWLFGSLPVYAIFGTVVSQKVSEPIKEKMTGLGFLIILSWACIGISMYGLTLALATAGGEALSSDAFREGYGRGWSAHARVITYSLLMYFIGVKAYKRTIISILIVLIFAFITIGTGKSWMFIPLCTGILYQAVTKQFKFNYKTAVKMIIGCFFIFNLAYLIRFVSADPSAIGNSEIYFFLFKHFFTYLSSGIMGLSERFTSGMIIQGADWRVVFAPIINIISFFSGSEIVSGVTEYWINTGPESASNVHTIFGTLYIHLGAIGGLVYVLCFSFLVNLFYAYAIIRRNSWLMLAALFELCLLAFGWFDNYSGNLMIIEVPFWTLVLMFASRIQIFKKGY